MRSFLTGRQAGLAVQISRERGTSEAGGRSHIGAMTTGDLRKTIRKVIMPLEAHRPIRERRKGHFGTRGQLRYGPQMVSRGAILVGDLVICPETVTQTERGTDLIKTGEIKMNLSGPKIAVQLREKIPLPSSHHRAKGQQESCFTSASNSKNLKQSGNLRTATCPLGKRKP